MKRPVVSSGAGRSAFNWPTSARRTVTGTSRRSVTPSTVSDPPGLTADANPVTSAASQLNSRILLVCRPDPAQLIQHGGEQVEQGFEPLHILDHAQNLEVQLVHALGELRTKPALAVLYLQTYLRLSLDHLPDL